MLIACLATMLAGCNPSSVPSSVSLPDLPADIRTCFVATVGIPSGRLSRKQVFRLIARLKRSELEKAKCGRRAIALYDGLRKGLKGGR